MDGIRNDTVVNAVYVGKVVWRIATWDLRKAVNVPK